MSCKRYRCCQQIAKKQNLNQNLTVHILVHIVNLDICNAFIVPPQPGIDNKKGLSRPNVDGTLTGQQLLRSCHRKFTFVSSHTYC